MSSALRLSRQDIGEKGEILYKQRIRALVDTESNYGKMVSIDVETGDYELDEVGITAAARLLARRPHAAVYGTRIGFDAVYVFDSAVTVSTTANKQ